MKEIKKIFIDESPVRLIVESEDGRFYELKYWDAEFFGGDVRQVTLNEIVKPLPVNK